jgi:hypothetical protein
MSAAEALRAAHAAGVTVMFDGVEGLLLEAIAEPPQAVLDLLARHKPSIVALLRSSQDGWTAEDWQARFDERAGFLEHDDGLSRATAEVQAFESCIVEWLNRNPSFFSLAGRCTWCRKPETPSAMVLPFGAGEHHAWLHAECWSAWYQRRREEAVLALKGMGISVLAIAKPLGLPSDEPRAKLVEPPSEAPQPQTQPSASNGMPEDRRGFVGYVDGRFVHYCPECGEWGAHGIGVFLRRGQLGVWYCAEHKPKT